MSVLQEEHLMEGKLTVQVSLNNIHPVLQGRLCVQRLEQRQIVFTWNQMLFFQ